MPIYQHKFLKLQKMKNLTPSQEKFTLMVYEYLKPLNVNVHIDFRGNNEMAIEPTNYKGNKLDGMQILFDANGYEVSEYKAGKNENELHIYKVTSSWKIALKEMIKGNKRKPIKIWN